MRNAMFTAWRVQPFWKWLVFWEATVADICPGDGETQFFFTRRGKCAYYLQVPIRQIHTSLTGPHVISARTVTTTQAEKTNGDDAQRRGRLAS
ncbi:hypothetical protein EDD16DRAFT_1612055 [Pisolithus croceorrhizus]|nr:hypothetical protein EDD16DRAFT_1612055 [Pisolithus croceorrhizus]